jgi:hypothetical protein
MVNELIYIGLVLNLATFLKPLISMSAETVTLKNIENKENYFTSVFTHFLKSRYEIILVFIVALLGYRFVMGFWLDVPSLILIVLLALSNIFVGLIVPFLIVKRYVLFFLLATILPQLMSLCLLLITWSDTVYIVTLLTGNFLFIALFHYRELRSFDFSNRFEHNELMLGNSTRVFTGIAVLAFLVRALTRLDVNTVEDEWLLRVYDISLLTYTTMIVPLIVKNHVSTVLNIFLHFSHIFVVPIIFLLLTRFTGADLSKLDILFLVIANLVRFELFRVSFKAVRNGDYVHSIIIDSTFQIISLVLILMNLYFLEAYLVAAFVSYFVYVGYNWKFQR